jgi:hypothetical protein
VAVRVTRPRFPKRQQFDKAQCDAFRFQNFVRHQFSEKAAWQLLGRNVTAVDFADRH